jgi:hypothetical protein
MNKGRERRKKEKEGRKERKREWVGWFSLV